jgi:hypothetical protein
MNIIQKVYNYIKWFFIRPIKEEQNIDSENAIGSITFSLYPNNDVDIFCFLPESASMTVDEISKVSENYGKFLSSITDGLVVDTMVKLLNQTKKDSESPSEQLFIENILFFWAINHVNNHSKNETKKKNKNRPVIRPTTVFAQTKTSFD